MKELNLFQGIDIYLFDQLLKGRISSASRVLDAGCGSGRNLNYLIKNSIDITGIDPNPQAIATLKAMFPELSDRFEQTTIEDYRPELGYDFIICNAVLHFAESHEHFDLMFDCMARQLTYDGVLFIRMTSDIGLSGKTKSLGDGRYLLPDNSERYLITRKKIDALLERYPFKLLDPVKTVNVDELRCMTTLVFSKSQ